MSDLNISPEDFRPMNIRWASAIAQWSYGADFNLYNVEPHEREEYAQGLIDPDNNYYAVLSKEDPIAFFCFGVDARVPGGHYAEEALDIGYGLRPDLLGKRLGKTLLESGLAADQREFVILIRQR